MTTITLTSEPTGWTTVAFRYDPDVIALVKSLQPHLRRYDPATKSWSVDSGAADGLAAMLSAVGHTLAYGRSWVVDSLIADLEDEGVIKPKADVYDAVAAARRIIDDLPGQHVGKVFREMAKLLYPDLYTR